jgi:hypothetical protein
MTEPNRSDFEEAGRQKRPSLVAEFVYFLKNNKKWWLLPILVVMGMVGLLVMLSSTGAAPFIYTLF